MKTLFKLLFWGVVLVLIIIAMALISANAYLQSNKTKLFEEIPFLANSTVTFDQAYIGIFDNFPQASLVLNNITISDSLYYHEGKPLLVADKLTAALSLKNWKNKEIELQNIKLSDGRIGIINNLHGNNNLESIISGIESAKKYSLKTALPSKFKFSFQSLPLHLILDNFNVLVVDSLKTSTIDVQIHHLELDLEKNDEVFESVTDIDCIVNELTFKEAEGSYLKDAHIVSKFDAIHKQNLLSIQPCELTLNDLLFSFDAQIATDTTEVTVLNLENESSVLKDILVLLPPTIENLVQPYQIHEPFYTKGEIILKKGWPARVDVAFELSDHNISVQNVPFHDVTLKGRFINRKRYTPIPLSEARGNIRIDLQDLTAKYETFELMANELLIKSNPITKASIKTDMHVSGSAKDISNWYKSDKFFFENGKFVLDANIHGPLSDFDNLLLASSAQLYLKDLLLHYQPADVSIPIKWLELEKTSEDAKFSILSSTLLHSYDFNLDGGLKNLRALLVALTEERASSQIHLASQKLGWEDIVSVFSNGKLGLIRKTEKASKKSMKETLSGLYNKFQPTAQVGIDTFEYYDKLNLFNFSTGLHFIDENNITLDETEFDLEQGKVNFGIAMDISHPHETHFDIQFSGKNINVKEILPRFDYFGNEILKSQNLPDDFNVDIDMRGIIDDVNGLLPNSAEGTITYSSPHYEHLKGIIRFKPDIKSGHSDYDVQLEGSPHLFNAFFKNDNFFFQENGNFKVNINYQGELSTMAHHIENSEIDFSIKDGAVFYKQADITFPLDDLELKIDQDTAQLSLQISSELLDREIDITGGINNITELIFANTNKRLSTHASIYSPLLNMEHAQHIFESPIDNATKRKVKRAEDMSTLDDKFKTLLSGLLNHLNPTLDVKIDTLVINDKYSLFDFDTACRIRDSLHFVLEETTFGFSGGSFELDGEICIDDSDEEIFFTNIRTQDIDIQKLLVSTDYFGSSPLREAEKIIGALDFELKFRGRLLDLNLIPESTDASLSFEFKNLEIAGLEPIEKIADKLFLSRFFKDIRFAPILDTLTMSGTRIDVPLMEIQSNSIELFAEGHLDNVDGTNLWLSIPLANLKNLNLDKDVPEKMGYAATKNKIYIEIFTDSNGDITSKLRLRKRKYYKQRDILDQFKEDKKYYKEIRKKKSKSKK